MIDLYGPRLAFDAALNVAVSNDMPGTSGGLIDTRPHLRKLIDTLYDAHTVLAIISNGAHASRILFAIANGNTARTRQIDFLEPKAAYSLVMDAARINEMPGIDGGLIDAKPHIRKLIDSMYARGFILARLADEAFATKVFEQLQTNETVNIES